MTDRDPLWSELEALGAEEPSTDAPQAPEPEVGLSETARQLDGEGYFDGLARQFGHERETRTRRAVEDSQGFSETGITGAVRDFFGRSRDAFQQGIASPLSVERSESWQDTRGVLGDRAGMLTPEQARETAFGRTGSYNPFQQSELELREWTAPAARAATEAIPQVSPEMAGPGLSVPANIMRGARGLIGAFATRQETALARAQAMMRGEAALPEMAQWRSLIEGGSRTVGDMFVAGVPKLAGIISGYVPDTLAQGRNLVTGQPVDWPVFEDNKLYKFGESVGAAVQKAFPGDPARQFEFSQTLVQGLASTAAFGGAGLVAHLVGAGPKGQLAVIALSGMAAQTPQEFERVTQAMQRGDATERDRIIVTLANSVLGASEAAPFAGTIGSNLRGFRARVGRGGEHAVEETFQEATQQGGQNVTRMLTYDPKQDPYEGVLESMVVAAISGFGYGTAFSGGGRQSEPAPVVQARAGARTQSDPAPTTQAPAPERITPAEIPATPVTPSDPYGLERFAPAPELSQEGQTEVLAPSVPETETPAQSESLGRIAAMADRPSDSGSGEFVLPPDVLEYLRETNPELAGRYGSVDPSVRSTDGSVTGPEAGAAPLDLGRPRRVVTPDGGMEVEATPEIVDLATLRAASGALQPRDRSRAESQTAIRGIAAALDPEQLLPSRVSDTGAPMVGPDGTIISGNGRVAAIREAYADPALRAQADAYRKALGPAAEGMAQPVLVMRLPQMQQTEAARFADLSNRSRIGAMSATERAQRDASAAGPEIMGLYQGGSFTAPANSEFFRAFSAGVVSAAERGALSRDGNLTKEGESRMAAAVLAAAYGDAELLSRMLESTDDNIRNLTGALQDSAGAFIRLKEAIRTGEADAKFDISPQVVETVQRIADLRDRNIRPDVFLAQQDAFTQVDPIVEGLIKAFYNDDLSRPLSRQKLAELLTFYAQEAAKHKADGLIPDQTQPREIVGLAREKATRVETLAERLSRAQGDLLGPGSASATGRSDAGTGREASGRSAADGRNGTGAKGASASPAAKQPKPSADTGPVTKPTDRQREFFSRLLKQKKPLKWSEVQSRLRASPEQMEALRQDALNDGLLRQDRHGVYRRTAKVQAQAEAGMPSLAGNPNVLSIPADVRIDNAIRIREAQTGKPVSPVVRIHAIRLMNLLGRARFTSALAEIKKDKDLKVADVRDLAHLVGYAPTAKSSKAEAYRLIANRHLDQKSHLERQARTQELAAFAQHAVEGSEQRRDLDELGFYSGAVEAARNIPQEKGTPEQMRAMLVKAGAKEAELKAVKFDEWLASRRGGDSAVKSGTGRTVQVSKSEIISFLESNRVEVRESEYSNRPGSNEPPSKWQSYSLDPSNPTYRETVIHLPIQGAETRSARFRELQMELANRADATDERRLEISREMDAIGAASHTADSQAFRTGHWSEPNIIAHARTSLQKDSDGKVVFLIDELQSDWGQKLREGGVRDEAKIAALKERHKALGKQITEALDAAVDNSPVAGAFDADGRHTFRAQLHSTLINEGMNFRGRGSSEEASNYARLNDEYTLLGSEIVTAEASTPGHPLVNTTDQWVTTMLRRLVSQAVAAGADKIAFTPGKVQAERYNLEHHVDFIKHGRYADGRYHVYVRSKVGRDVLDGTYLAEELPGVVGREIADKIIAREGVLEESDSVRSLQERGRGIEVFQRGDSTSWFIRYEHGAEMGTWPSRESAQREMERMNADYIDAPVENLTHVLRGDNLRVGGEGMRATYDGIYPRALAKILQKMDKSIKQGSESLKSSEHGQVFGPEVKDALARDYLRHARDIDHAIEVAHSMRDLPGNETARIQRAIDALEAAKPSIQFHTFPLTDKVKAQISGGGQSLFSFASARSQTGLEEREALTDEDMAVGRLQLEDWFADQGLTLDLTDEDVRDVAGILARGASVEQALDELAAMRADEETDTETEAEAAQPPKTFGNFLRRLLGRPQVLAAFQSAGSASFLRTKGIPATANPPLMSYPKDTEIKSHADYTAAKAGDMEAAGRLVVDLVRPENIAEALSRFGTEAIYIPVIAEEATGKNKIPEMLAQFYAASTGAAAADDIFQISRAYHTGARPMERMISRPAFDGEVIQGGRYVLVDDVSVMGGTLAELAHFIQSNGGDVAGIVTLVNASRGGVYTPTPKQVRQIEERYGDQIREWLAIEPSALTADEASYILNFRDADQLRTSVVKAGSERNERLRAKGLRPSEAGEQGSEDLAAFQPRPYTAQFQARSAEVASAIQRELERMVPQDVPVRMMDRLMVGPAEALERVQIQPGGALLLDVSMAQGADTAKIKGFHGVTHVLRESGLWSDAEWNLLVERANKTDAAERLNTPMVYEGRTIPMIEGYRTFYTQQARRLGFSEAEVAAQVEEQINQELVAALAESWAEGTSYGKQIDTLLDRILKFFEAVRNALNGLGFQTADDIFERVVSGEVARRAEGGRREPTFDPFPNKPSPEEYHLSTEEGMAALDVLMGGASAEAMFAFSGRGGDEAVKSGDTAMSELPRPFPLNLPGFNGTVTESVKASGERIRRYFVNLDIAVTATESDPAPLQRLQEEGFTTVAYHGTGDPNFVSFDPSKSRWDAGAVWFTDNRIVSNRFAHSWAQVEGTTEHWNKTLTRTGAAVIPVRLKTEGFAEVDWPTYFEQKMGDKFNPRIHDGIAEEAALVKEYKARGVPGIILRRATEEAGPKGAPVEHTAYAVFDTSNITRGGGDSAVKSGDTAMSALPKSSLIVSEQADGSWELSFFKGSENVQQIVAAIESDIGNRLSPKGWLTPQGYRYWQSTDPQSVRFHQNAGDVFGGMYASPRAVEFGIAVLGKPDTTGTAQASDVQSASSQLQAEGFDTSKIYYRGETEGRAPTDRGHYGQGTYLSTGRNGAEGYGNVTEYYARVQNPLVLKVGDYKSFASTLERIGFVPERRNELLRRDRPPTLARYIYEWDRNGPAEVTRLAKAAGHDGIIAGEELVVFDRANMRPVQRGGAESVKSGTAEMSELSKLKSSLPPEAFTSERNEQMFAFSSDDNRTPPYLAPPGQDGGRSLAGDVFKSFSDRLWALYVSLKHRGELAVSDVDSATMGKAAGVQPAGSGYSAHYARLGASLKEAVALVRDIQQVAGRYVPVDNPDRRFIEDRPEDTLRLLREHARSLPSGDPRAYLLAALARQLERAERGRALVSRLIDAHNELDVAEIEVTEFRAANTDVAESKYQHAVEVQQRRADLAVIENEVTQTLAAFSSDDRIPPFLAPPGQVAQPTSPTGGKEGDVRGLTDIIEDLKETLGLTTTQGRYGLTVVDRKGGRRFRFPAQPNVRGQYDRNAGVARIKIATDIDAIAHEGGHHLERVFGAELETLKQAHAEELGTRPAPNAPLPPLSSAGFSGLELDADTQAVLVQAVTALREWRLLSSKVTDRRSLNPLGRAFPYGREEAAEAGVRAARATSTLERRLGQTITHAMIADILGDSRVGAVVGVSPLRQAARPFGTGVVLEIPPESMSTYVAERYSRNGAPQPRNVPTPTPLQISEGFAEFFRRYITDPDAVRRELPGVYTAFEDFLDAADPALLENLEKVQLQALSKDYKDYRNATALERLKADTVSEADRRFMTRAKEFLTQIGQGETWSGMASSIYEAGIDENHSHYLVTRMMLEAGDENRVTGTDGRALSLAVHENPYKLMRSVGDAFKTGLRWFQDGMPQYRHADAGFNVVDAAGKVLAFRPTLAGAQAFAGAQADPVTIAPRAADRSKAPHEALVLAMGDKWDIGKYENFGTYLIARRGVEEWARYMEGKLERKPMKSYATGQPADEIAAHVETIRKYEAANPNFSAAAQIVYDFLWAQAVHDFQAGRLTQAELDYRATRKHFYVPFARSMKDIVATRGIGGRVQKFSKDQRFKGSDRAIMNPIETIIDQTFHKAAATHFNDVMKAYAALSDKVGPGGAAIAERVEKSEVLEANNEAFRRLESDFLGLGYNADDVREMVKRIESDFGDTQLLLQWSPDSLGPVRPLMLPLWENGERKFIRINDPEWAANVYNSLNGIGRELSSLFIEVVARPATLLRVGVTTHPAFIGPNVIRDMWQAFTLTGSVLDPRTWPGVTQIRGLYHELAQTDMARLYQEVGGIMGGQNVAALSKVRDKADVMALKEKGLQIKPVNLSIAAGIGGAAGFAVGGPIGAGVGALFGGALHRGPRHFFSDLAHFADMSETATRLGTFTSAYDAALAYNPSLTPYQAAQEAAYVARDLIDFGRRGGRMLAAARLVPFMNANIQGLDKAVRQLLARSDRGMQVSTTKLVGLMAAGAATGLVAGPAIGAAATFAAPAIATNLAARSAAVRALLAPFTKKDMGIPTSRNDEQAMGMSAKAWTNLALYSLILLAFSYLYADDDEYKQITPRVKVRNQPVKLDGEWYMFPKAFEWALPSVIIEAALDSQFRNDTRFAERVREGLYETLTPPGIAQTGRLWRDIGANYNSMTGRPIVAEHFRSDPPELQFNAYASQFAIAVSKFVNERPAVRSTVESVGGAVFATPRFELTPAIVDYALSTGLGYWGKDAQKASNVATVGGSRVVDYPLVGTAVQRFTLDPNRVSDAVDAYWKAMGQEHEGYRRAANGYKRYNEMYGPAGANTYLATLHSPEQRAYALLESSGTTAARRAHPLNRLKGVVTATMDMERDLALERLADTTSMREPERIVLSPARRNEVRDALAAIRAVEAHNTMVTLRHRQFSARDLRPLQPALDMLNAASPEAFAEYERRARRQHVGDFAEVASAWPETRETLLRTWQEAVDEQAAMVRTRGKRTPERLPIGTSRPPQGDAAPIMPSQVPRLDYWGASPPQ